MHALFRAWKRSEISRRGFKGTFKYLFAILSPFPRSPFRFPDEMAATANRSANELSPFAWMIARLFHLYGFDRVHAISPARETLPRTRRKKIFSSAGRRPIEFRMPPLLVVFLLFFHTSWKSFREKCDRVEAQCNKSITNYNYLTSNITFVTRNNKNRREKIIYFLFFSISINLFSIFL